MTPAIVWWHDAHADASGWTHLDHLEHEPRTIRTCGWLLDHSKSGHLSIAQSVDGELVDNVIHIPTAVVQRIRRF